jgi:uncharacterized membrane protein YphA (DoxX/SURF4 family)
MKIALWIVQVVLAVAFLAHGVMMLVPPASVAEQMNTMLPRWFQIFLGAAEVAAAIGLTVPAFTRIQARLVPMAAFGIVIVMICATALHASRGETSAAGTTLVLLLLAGLVAWQRWKVHPIPERTA